MHTVIEFFATASLQFYLTLAAAVALSVFVE
jgi:hypothetical protein